MVGLITPQLARRRVLSIAVFHGLSVAWWWRFYAGVFASLSAAVNFSEVPKGLRKNGRYQRRPMIALTTATTEHDIESVQSLFGDYMAKPIEINKLFAPLEKYLY